LTKPSKFHNNNWQEIIVTTSFYVIHQRRNGAFARRISPRLAARKFEQLQPVLLATPGDLRKLGVVIRESLPYSASPPGRILHDARPEYQVAELICCS
jgi:hypothetical protein